MQLKIQAFEFSGHNVETALLSSGTLEAGGPDSEQHDKQVPQGQTTMQNIICFAWLFGLEEPAFAWSSQKGFASISTLMLRF